MNTNQYLNANSIASSMLSAMPLSFPLLSSPTQKEHCTKGRLLVLDTIGGSQK